MVILITGASSGIGLSAAKYLAEKGYNVYGTSRKAEMGSHENGITYLKLDVTDHNSVKAAAQYLLSKEQQIDVVVNNAGIGMVGSVEDSSIEEMKTHFETNYYGAVHVMQAFLPKMREQGFGKIINISSLAGIFGLPYRGVYCAAKAALNLLTESMRMELLTYGIHAIVVAPGDIKTKIDTSRIKAKRSKTSVYRTEFDQVHDIMNEELQTSSDPIKVAQVIHKCIKAKNPKPFYLAASPFQKLVVNLRYWLPTRLFQKLMMNNYKMKT
ncbi:MAG: SDR family oxidoreductase [Flavobacteriales bacterium]|nr:SDR family oxidoreductase [Flavobacteriales bacterium]